jgi:molybdopterin-binding protein
MWGKTCIVIVTEVHSLGKGVIMKISARNQLKGTIVSVEKGAVTSYVKIDVGGNIITSSISNAAVEDLGLEAGQEAYAIIKASSVMVGVDH